MLLTRSFTPALLVIAACGCTIRLKAAQLCVSVIDEGQLPIPGAIVRVLSLQSNSVEQRITETDGKACFERLRQGPYSVEGSREGFLNVKYYPLQISFPEKNRLTIRLPLGGATEGGVSRDVVLSGTLRSGGKPVEAVKICLLTSHNQEVTCTSTNDLGEYALVASAAIYQVELTDQSGMKKRYQIDVSVPGAFYRDKLTLGRN